MRTRAFIASVAGLIALASFGVAWKYGRSAQKTELAFGVLAQRKAQVEIRVHRLSAQLTAEAKAKAAPAAKVKAHKNTLAARLASLEESVRRFEENEKDPKIQLLELASLRATAAASYGRFFRLLGLNQAQIDTFQDNVAKRQELQFDLNNVVWSEAAANNNTISSETSFAINQLTAHAENDYQTAQTALLGQAGYAQLQEYERALPAQDVVSGLAGAAVLAGTPFTAQQSEQLTQVLANASSDYQAGQAATVRTINWNTVDAQASAILSESQLGILTTMEPPLGGNSRFFSQLTNAVNKAAQADAASKTGSTE